MQVLVFKTNVKYKKQVSQVMPHLNNISGIIRWNVDLHDTDKILRIESLDLSASVVENTLQHAGYFCKELED